MLFKQKLGQSNVTSLVERVSRFTVILKNPNKRTKPVMEKIMSAIKELPLIARRSITFDRGTEFVSWPHLQAEIGTQTWFCDPSSPSRDIATRYPVDLSRFDAAPLIASTATKETNYGTETHR